MVSYQNSSSCILHNIGSVQEIYCASISNIDSVVAGTSNILVAEPFIFWLARLHCFCYNVFVHAATPTFTGIAKHAEETMHVMLLHPYGNYVR